MKYKIEVHAEKSSRTSLDEDLATAARAVLELESAAPGSLSIVLTSEKALQDANRKYAGVDQPTDVLSFSDSESLPGEEGVYYGDILISVQAAEKQALHGGHSTLDELRLLTIHGTLHLLGHDHAQPEEKKRMWSLQAKALREIGVDPEIVREQA
ncbi:MAG: rRNA maturation RNase YbeY [Anaerolineales bacterium]|jgi:probable rRNA maturation factor